MVHDQRSSYRPRTMERSARLVAHGVLTPRMVVGLLIGLPLAPIQDASDALDDEGRQVVNRR